MSTVAARGAPDILAPGAIASDETSTNDRRVRSIDIIRGAVMVLMAIDHVRVFAGVPPGGPEYGVFFTRWVTHFCAPAFLFVAGTSAFLYGSRPGRGAGELSRFLLTRGAWLVLLELTVLRLAWTFNTDFASYNLAGVIWVIGWCMILMAALVHLPLRVVGAIGLAIVFGHNLLDHVPGLAASARESGLAPLWSVLYFGGPVEIGDGGPRLVVLYSLVPWIGVMAAGYAFGPVVRMEPGRRRRICLRIGLGAIAAFLVLRFLDVHGDPGSWREGTSWLPATLSFLNTTKYPASLLFLLMTLGPAIALVPLLDRARGRIADALVVFGRVPFFYYVLHIPLIHAVAAAISLVRYGEVVPWLFGNHPMEPPPVPDGYAYGLPMLYLVTAAVVVALYFPCRWFARLKERRRDAWLSYL